MKLYRKVFFTNFDLDIFGKCCRKVWIKQILAVCLSCLFLMLYYRPDYSTMIVSNFVAQDSQWSSSYNNSETCVPAKKVAFMKNHKCASSTIENIMFRYAYKHNLNVVVAAKGNYLSTTKLFTKEALSNSPWKGLDFHIFTLHNRWNHDEVIALMGNETRTFSVIRDPVDVFESLYGYMRLNQSYGVDIKNFVKLLRNTSAAQVVNKRRFDRFGRNQIAWDLGISPQTFDNDILIEEQIKRLDRQFELVMVAERLQESLILLRHLLCWPVEYMTHLNLNMRKPEHTVKLDSKEREELKRWLRVDYEIYNYFLRKLEEKIDHFNRQHEIKSKFLFTRNLLPIQIEMKQLQDANELLQNKCVIQKVGNEKLKGKFKETNNVIMGYVVNETIADCHLFAMSEPAFLAEFRKRLQDQVDKSNPQPVNQK